MNIRLNGPVDLLERVRKVLGIDEKIYPNRGSTRQARMYVNMDDRLFEALLDKIEQSGAELPRIDTVSGSSS